MQVPDVTRLAINTVNTAAFDEWKTLLNLHLHEPAGQPLWWKDSCGDLYAEIGQIGHGATDGIHIFPYGGISADDLEVLMGAAIEAASTKPSARTGWSRCTRNGRRGWLCTISTSTVSSDVVAAIRAAETRQECNSRVTRACAPHP